MAGFGLGYSLWMNKKPKSIVLPLLLVVGGILAFATWYTRSNYVLAIGVCYMTFFFTLLGTVNGLSKMITGEEVDDDRMEYILQRLFKIGVGRE